MDHSEIRKVCGDLFDQQGLAVLSTQCDGQPYSNLVAFAVTENLNHLIFATKRNTRKYSNLRNNPRVALLMDNRRNLASDFNEATAITVMGEARELDSNQDEIDIYLAKHPNLQNFATQPDCAIFKVTIDNFIIASSILKVTSIRGDAVD